MLCFPHVTLTNQSGFLGKAKSGPVQCYKILDICTVCLKRYVYDR